MNFQFYGYSVRSTIASDLPLAMLWTRPLLPGAQYPADDITLEDLRETLHQLLDAGRFWFQPERENFFVHSGDDNVAFFQIEPIKADQVRLHFLANPFASPKNVLRGITKLVPLIEKALSMRGVKKVFFTSHSQAMAEFVGKRLQYRPAGDGGRDGVVMAKGLE